MDIEEYNIDIEHAPAEYVSEYIELKHFKKVRFNATSDTDGILLLEYSTDKSDVNITTEIRMPANKWLSFALEPKMPFVRIHLKMIKEGAPVKVLFTGTSIPKPPVSTGWFF